MPTVTAYTPYGLGQTELENVKIGYTESGRVGFYQQVPGRSMWQLASSGSNAALQSGGFTIGSPETALVYTQAGAGTTFSPTANREEAMRILANPGGYSRPGAEAYGGYVMPLDTRTIESTGAKLSTYANPYNLAGLVNPQAVNLPKEQQVAMGDVPWGNKVGTGTPTIFKMNAGVMEPAVIPEGMQQAIPAARGTPIVSAAPATFNGLYVTGASVPKPVAQETGQPQYVYRSDPLAVALEGAAFLGDSLTFGMWKPGSEQLTRYGQNVNQTDE
jgi:hypothetical protein